MILHSVKKLVYSLKTENDELREEVGKLKQKLQYRHTEINDLRYTKKMLKQKLRVLEGGLKTS